MKDTPFEIEEKLREMLRKKTPLERLEMWCSMYRTSKELVLRFILEENPGISSKELKQQFFLKFYGQDFDASTREKIVEHLGKV